jgi:hypothetical protein
LVPESAPQNERVLEVHLRARTLLALGKSGHANRRVVAARPAAERDLAAEQHEPNHRSARGDWSLSDTRCARTTIVEADAAATLAVSDSHSHHSSDQRREPEDQMERDDERLQLPRHRQHAERACTTTVSSRSTRKDRDRPYRGAPVIAAP